MTPRRVVAALHLSEPSGPSRSLLPVLERLRASGADVTIAVPGPGEVAEEASRFARIVALGHGPLVLPHDARSALASAPRLRSETRRFRGLLREARADLAIVATTSLPAFTLACRLERVPAVVYAAELFAGGRRSDVLRAAIRRQVIDVNARLATVVVACSREVAAHVRTETPHVVVHPVIDPQVGRGDGAALRQRHAIPATGPVLATLGNITFGRGQDVAIRVLAELAADHPGARLVVAGAPHDHPPDLAFRNDLPAVARRLGVADRVHLCGFERAADVLAACDVFLNPVRGSESFGIAAVEALVAGRPVVSTDVGAIPEVLTDGVHALLVPPDRPEAMAAAVRRLLGDPGFAARLVDAGRRRALAEFTAERQHPRFDEAVALALARAQ